MKKNAEAKTQENAQEEPQSILAQRNPAFAERLRAAQERREAEQREGEKEDSKAKLEAVFEKLGIGIDARSEMKNHLYGADDSLSFHFHANGIGEAADFNYLMLTVFPNDRSDDRRQHMVATKQKDESWQYQHLSGRLVGTERCKAVLEKMINAVQEMLSL